MPVPRKVIIEYCHVGNSVKVSAICEDTGVEVSIVGDPRASKGELEALAVRKLNYVMEKREREKLAAKKGLSV